MAPTSSSTREDALALESSTAPTKVDMGLKVDTGQKVDTELKVDKGRVAVCVASTGHRVARMQAAWDSVHPTD